PMSNPRLTQTRKKSSFADAFRRFFGAIWRYLRRDRLSTLLLVATIALLITFFSLLGSLAPEGHGQKVPLSTITSLGTAQRIADAVMLDYDDQVQVTTTTGVELYADYPSSGAATQTVYQDLTKGAAHVQFDPQSGKEARVIVIQFLLPILILVCLFAF